MRSFDSRNLLGRCVALSLAAHRFPCSLRHRNLSVSRPGARQLSGRQLDSLDRRHLVPSATVEQAAP
jgi:hypothetical protein